MSQFSDTVAAGSACVTVLHYLNTFSIAVILNFIQWEIKGQPHQMKPHLLPHPHLTPTTSTKGTKILVESPVMFEAIRLFLEALRTTERLFSHYLVLQLPKRLASCALEAPRYARLPHFRFCLDYRHLCVDTRVRHWYFHFWCSLIIMCRCIRPPGTGKVR